MRSRFFASIGALVTTLALACDEVPSAQPCSNIPAGGCPATASNVCDDPTCLAVYECVNADWVYDFDCPAREGGVDASVEAASDAPVRGARDVDIDVPGAGGGPGCADLQAPDCTLETAVDCPAAGCCDCQDLFVCQNGGWQFWGTCLSDGGIQPQ